MGTRTKVALAACIALVLTLAAAPLALADNTAATYHLDRIIPVPGNALKSYDISFVDRSSQTYFLADRSNAGVDIVDARTGTFVARVGGFVGFHGSNDTAGPNGVLVVHDQHEAWAGDGDSTVKVIDLKTRRIVATISTGGTKRADEMAFDRKDHLLVVANDADDVPFITFIDTRSRKVLGKISFPDATNGLEQSVWDPQTHHVYLSIPQLGPDPANGGIAVIDPRTRTLLGIDPVKECQPAGLALGPKQHLLLGCSKDAVDAGFPAQSQIMDARSGKVIKVITQVGGSDEVWFNPGDKHYYLAARGMPGGPVLGVIDAKSDTWIQNVPTGPGSHSVAADPINNHIFVPLSGKGIGVYEQ